ncbi:hypothetical protein QFC22_001154 [Naganishia vaughanmartiniae]|uniref:Uncharacterized protein n=1 Tax=Naganishia vaughanmartiniae TaxID=1424756 RepID=A0ACC2XLN7_9TREE|nr:hypothetical protein QFC22_001154 [Naganishia vaughanmartiniae]
MPALRSADTTASRILPDGTVACATPSSVVRRVGPPPAVINPNAAPTAAAASPIRTVSTQAPAETIRDPNPSGEHTVQEYMDIIAEQQRRIQTLINRDLTRQIAQNTTYPIGRPSFATGGEYRLPCTRLILGLRYFPGERGMINRRIWNEMQANTRAVISAATYYEHIPQDAEWKKLAVDRKKYLTDQLVNTLKKTLLHRETIYVDGNLTRAKFYAHWPLELMLINALATDRTASHNKKLSMDKLDASLTTLRTSHAGRPAWLGTEVLRVPRAANGQRGRPAINGHVSEEEGGAHDSETEEVDMQ